MAADIPKKRLCDKTTCYFCLNFFTDPVVLECGHSFCKDCIISCWGEPFVLPLFCPKCQETIKCKTLWPNKQLGNIADIARQLHDQVMKEAVVWGICEHHLEPLKFFCRDDESCFCTVCKRFKRHSEHRVVLVEAAVEEYKDQLCTCLENLRKKKEELLVSKDNIEKQSQDLTNMIDRERQKTVAAFRELRQFLEEEEKLNLAQMEEVDKEVAKKRDEELARLSEELASLENSIQELQEKSEGPPGDLLKDITSTLQRSEKQQKENFENPVAFPLALKWRIWEFWDIGFVFQKMMKDFEDSSQAADPTEDLSGKGTGLSLLKSECQLHKENMTLDPQTAHPKLLVSEDGKCLTFCDQPRSLPPSSLRFVRYSGVLASKWFQSGRHFWDVDVGKEEGWAVGVCVLPLQFDKDKPPGPEAGVWCIGRLLGHYRAIIHPRHPPLLLKEEPRKIRVLLNFKGQQVVFFDAHTAAFLHVFSLPVSRYSTYFPFFGLWKKSCLRLDP